jgi:hypothetical protein
MSVTAPIRTEAVAKPVTLDPDRDLAPPTLAGSGAVYR